MGRVFWSCTPVYALGRMFECLSVVCLGGTVIAAFITYRIFQIFQKNGKIRTPAGEMV